MDTTKHNLEVDEYIDASNNMRHYGNHQVAIIAIFFTFNGVLAAILFDAVSRPQFFVDLGAKIILIFVNGLFWIKVESAIFMWDHFFRRALILEEQLGFEQYKTLPGYPKFKVRPAKWAIRLLFVSTVLFWLIALILDFGK